MEKEFVDFKELKGKILTRILGLEKDNGVVYFYTSDGDIYKMYHEQDCCESVSIEDVCGDVEDLIDAPILLAECVCSDENPEDSSESILEYQDSFTWTFYKLSTMKGDVTIRWYGTSNGYYSESVDFVKIKE